MRTHGIIDKLKQITSPRVRRASIMAAYTGLGGPSESCLWSVEVTCFYTAAILVRWDQCFQRDTMIVAITQSCWWKRRTCPTGH